MQSTFATDMFAPFKAMRIFFLSFLSPDRLSAKNTRRNCKAFWNSTISWVAFLPSSRGPLSNGPRALGAAALACPSPKRKTFAPQCRRKWEKKIHVSSPRPLVTGQETEGQFRLWMSRSNHSCNTPLMQGWYLMHHFVHSWTMEFLSEPSSPRLLFSIFVLAPTSLPQRIEN